jgi:hypothetical protein
MNRAAMIEQLKQTQEMIAKLLSLLEAGEADKLPLTFTSHADNTGALPSDQTRAPKAIEREIISSYQIAQSLGFNGDFRAWEHLLRIHE